MGRLDNRVAIVTGGSGYLGKSHSLHLAREGARVVVADIVDGAGTVSAIKEEGGDAVWVRTDVTDEESTKGLAQATLDQFGRIDILVNNAALIGQNSKPFTEISLEEWQRNIDVDLTGMFLCAKAIVPAMKEAGYGRMVNISSCRALVGGANQFHYVSAKAGVIGLTRALATELGEFGITVNAVLPGLYDRDLEATGTISRPRTEERRQQQAIKRYGEASDLSPAIVFFASDDAGFITGQALAVDGGGVRSGG